MIKRRLQLNQLLIRNSILLLGARGTGKSSLVKEFLKQKNKENLPFLIFDFLHLDILQKYKTNLSLFRAEVDEFIAENNSGLIYIDEVQLFPEILNEVHSLIEEYKNKIKFVLTGSSARKLKRENANLLAGRAISCKLFPISILEEDLKLNKSLRFGCLPQFYLEKDPSDNLKSYVNTYLKEEIIQEALVRKIDSFHKFIEIAAQYNGRVINFSSLAKSLKIASTTTQEYFSILIDTLIATRVDPWSHSVKKQLLSNPKFYFFDCGVLNTINKTLTLEPREGTYLFGNLFETFILNELVKHKEYLKKDFEINHYAIQSGDEIDFILNCGPYKEPIAIEIKSSDSPDESNFKVMEKFKSDYPNAKLFCICLTENPYTVGNVSVLSWKNGIKKILDTID